jgi:hypothetical protein
MPESIKTVPTYLTRLWRNDGTRRGLAAAGAGVLIAAISEHVLATLCRDGPERTRSVDSARPVPAQAVRIFDANVGNRSAVLLEAPTQLRAELAESLDG